MGLTIKPEAEEIEPIARSLGLESGDGLDELSVPKGVSDFEDVFAEMSFGEVGAVAVPLVTH
jgi:hypothetical protein